MCPTFLQNFVITKSRGNLNTVKMMRNWKLKSKKQKIQQEPKDTKPKSTKKLKNGPKLKSIKRFLLSTLVSCGTKLGLKMNKPIKTEKQLPDRNKTLSVFENQVRSGVFSNKGKYFIACTARKLIMYNSETELFTTNQTFTANQNHFYDVAICPAQTHFAYSCYDGPIYLYKISSDLPSDGLKLVQKENKVLSQFYINFCPQNFYLVCAGTTGVIYLYDLVTYSCIFEARHSKIGGINSITFLDKMLPNVVVSGGDDALIKFWDKRVPSYKNHLGQLIGHISPVTHVESRGDGRYLVSKSSDGFLKLWDARFKKINADTSLKTFNTYDVDTFTRCRFSPESTGQRFIYTGGDFGTFRVLDSCTLQMKKLYCGHRSEVRDVYWHPYRTEILTSSLDCSIKLFYQSKYHFLYKHLSKVK